MSDRIRVLFLCLGNICRSPLGEGLFRHHVEAQGLQDRFEIDSAGTSGWHAGDRPDPGSVRIAAQHGVDISGQRSRAFRPEDAQSYDFIVAMDRSNRGWVAQRFNLPPERLLLARAFDPESRDDEVPDPWGGGPGGFQEVWDILSRATPPLLTHILHHGPRNTSGD